MDYKELHQEMYEDLVEKLGREPTIDEMHCGWGDLMGSMIDAHGEE